MDNGGAVTQGNNLVTGHLGSSLTSTAITLESQDFIGRKVGRSYTSDYLTGPHPPHSPPTPSLLSLSWVVSGRSYPG